MELFLRLISKKYLLILLFLPIILGAEFTQYVTETGCSHELPTDHKVRKYLDKLFSKSRFIANVDTLKEAGFEYQGPRKHTGLIVAKHHKTPGYVYKIYTDAQKYYKHVPEYQLWLMRIEGAQRIRDYIDQKHWGDRFRVPKKWIYIIPQNSLSPEGYYVKQTLLVEEDMNILSDKRNLEMWKGEGITTTLLDQLYQIITDLGLKDCAKPDNLPFCIDGRIAFIDTQTFDASTVSYYKLTFYLSMKNRIHWIQLSN